MDKATRRSLTTGEFALLRATQRKEMEGLDEDALLELHGRVRRARNKYAKLHRRKAAAQVTTDRARGKAAQKPIRPAAKAEVFEDALARVSRRLAVVARQASEELKAERLAAARAGTEAKGKAKGKATKGMPAKGKPAKGKPAKAKAAARRPIEKKKVASTRAKGKRTQARRDAR